MKTGITPLLAATLALCGLSLAPATSTEVAAAQDRVTPHENTIGEVTEQHLPGNRLVVGRVQGKRSGSMAVDIGHPKLLYVPVKAGEDKGFHFSEGDPIVITMNEQNAIVDYHHPSHVPRHQLIYGRLITPLTVGLDKAVIGTDSGERTYSVYPHIRAKFGAVPVNVPAIFLADERGQLVDVYMGSKEAMKASEQNNKQHLKGAHRRLAAQYLGKLDDDRIKVKTNGKEAEQTLTLRLPLHKLDALRHGQDIVLLLDDQDKVIEVATPDAPPER